MCLGAVRGAGDPNPKKMLGEAVTAEAVDKLGPKWLKKPMPTLCVVIEAFRPLVKMGVASDVPKVT